MDVERRGLSLGLLVLRVGFGLYLMTSGWRKLQMVLDGRFEDFGDAIGLGSTASLLLVTFAELVCAFLVGIGLLTRLAAIPPAITMFVAAFVVHASDPWTMGGGGASKQPALMFLIPFLALALTGPGDLSIDAALRRRKR